MTDEFDFDFDNECHNNKNATTPQTTGCENAGSMGSIFSKVEPKAVHNNEFGLKKNKRVKRRKIRLSNTTNNNNVESPDSNDIKKKTTTSTTKVRFSPHDSIDFIENNSLTNSVPRSRSKKNNSATISKNNNGTILSAGRGKKKERKGRTIGGWMDEKDERETINGSTSYSARSRSSYSERPPRELKTISRLSYSEKPPRELKTNTRLSTEFNLQLGRSDAMAMQDAGNFQMLQDDCVYICSTITLAQNSSEAMIKKGSLDAAIDLSMMLSCEKKRSLLFQHLRKEKHDNTLNMILGVLDHMTQQISKNNNDCNKMLRSEIVRLDGIELAAKQELWDNNNVPKQDTGRKQTENGKRRIPDCDRDLNDTLSSIVHFLSWECTSDKKNSTVFRGNNSENGRKIRKMILQHPDGLKAIAHLILADSLVQSMLFPREEERKPDMIVPKRDEQIPMALSQDSVLSTISERPYDFSQETAGNTSLSTPTPKNVSSPEEAGSVLSMGSTSSTATVDPTASGRRRRKNRRLTGNSSSSAPYIRSIPEHDDHDDMFSIQTSQSDIKESICTMSEKINKLRSLPAFEKKYDSLVVNLARHGSCGGFDSQKKAASSLALSALRRIIKIPEEDDSNDRAQYSLSHDKIEESPDDEEVNPVLETNEILENSGIIPLIGQAMAETLALIARDIERGSPTKEDESSGVVIHHLHERCLELASLIDDSCLFNDTNRRGFCEEEEHNGCHRGNLLISSIVRLLISFVEHRESVYDYALLSDIMLSVLRTLTSLTHENDVAAEHLSLQYKEEIPSRDSCSLSSSGADLAAATKSWRGVDIIVKVLFQIVGDRQECVTTKKESVDENKVKYDMIIFCLNTLANVSESQNVRNIIANVTLPSFTHNSITDSDENDCCGEPKRVPFVTWLAQWLLNETEGFRDAVMEGSFGKSSSSINKSSRGLKSHEHDLLVTAGNGCILLACLMVNPDDGNRCSDKVTRQARNHVLEAMPHDTMGKPTGIIFIKNTLKAFSNFLCYNLGDLSVAVVVPVKILIKKLEEEI